MMACRMELKAVVLPCQGFHCPSPLHCETELYYLLHPDQTNLAHPSLDWKMVERDCSLGWD